MNRTTIEWTTALPGVAGYTLNLSTGCGPEFQCWRRCYARRMAKRLHAMGKRGYGGFRPTFHASRAEQPGKVKKGGLVFCGSMTDWLHPGFNDLMVATWLSVANLQRQHFYLFLTKRAERLADLPRIAERHSIPWPLPNVGLGVTCENQEWADKRIPYLLRTPAALRFVSVEPCLSSLDMTRYIGYNPTYEIQESRIEGVRGGEVGVDRNCPRRNHLEDGRNAGKQVELQGDLAAGEATTSRARHRSLLDGPPYDGGDSNSVHGASPNLAACQRPDSRGQANQPYQRRQERQPPGESGGSNDVGKYETRLPHGIEGRTRREEPCSETDRRSGGGNPQDLFDRRNNPGTTGGDVQCGIPDNIKDSQGRSKAKAKGPSGGLFSQKTAQKLEERHGDRSISFVIVGGESGPGARPMHPEWARSLRDQCKATGTPFLFKQGPGDHGEGLQKKPYLDGKQWLEVPDVIKSHFDVA